MGAEGMSIYLYSILYLIAYMVVGTINAVSLTELNMLRTARLSSKQHTNGGVCCSMYLDGWTIQSYS
jgi:hypothetical protein